MKFIKIIENILFCNIFSSLVSISIKPENNENYKSVFIKSFTSTLSAIIGNLIKYSLKDFLENKMMTQAVCYATSIVTTPLCASIVDGQIKSNYYNHFLSFEKDSLDLKVNFINSAIQTYYIEKFIDEYFSDENNQIRELINIQE